MTERSEGWKRRLKPPKARGRLIELDILRGFLLLWMTLTHLPTQASLLSNQTFGFVSGAEGFIFLAGFMVGQLEFRREKRDGEWSTVRDLARRTARVYAYHAALLAITFTVFAYVAATFHRQSLENLLSYFFHMPKHAVIAAFLLQYRPSLLDILPMYVIFMALTPLARAVGNRWGWDPVIYTSFAIWAAAQFGLRIFVHSHVHIFGISVPEDSIGAFDLFGWQLLWMIALALGTIYADSLYESEEDPARREAKLPKWLITVSLITAAIFLVLRYSPVEKWVDGDVLGWLIDKWHLGAARVINFAAMTVVLTRYGSRIAGFKIFSSLATLGQASLEVFCVHVLCCFVGHTLSPDADPNLPLFTQLVLIVGTLAAMYGTAYAAKAWNEKRKAARNAAAPAG
jgi:hypothetical protein